MNFWHIFDPGSKFEILKPNSSWLTFGISKFASLSISHFLFLFLQLFYIVLSYTNIVLPFQLLHLKITTFGYIISKFPPSAISFQNSSFGYIIFKLPPLAIPSQNLFIVSNSTSLPVLSHIHTNRLLFCVEHHRSSKQNSILTRFSIVL